MSEFSFGAHTFRIEPELVSVRLVGTVSLIEAAEFTALLEQAHALHGELYMLFDAAQLDTIVPPARRLFVDWLRRHPRILVASANFGGGVVQRTMAQLLASAVRLLVGFLPPQSYHETEAEARAWLAAQRARAPR